MNNIEVTLAIVSLIGPLFAILWQVAGIHRTLIRCEAYLEDLSKRSK